MRSGIMRLWVLVLISFPLTKGQLRETEFECGRHGRFEYCIDGVPGCVVGCHCHPGYYFDTDTKICEPNIKLTQNFRRNNYEVPEPTRVYMPPMPMPTPPTFVDNQPSSPKNAVDEKIDIITKDADDLGDWLYNQFFKTIENQVINETKDESIITRRSENAPTVDRISKPTRRSHKYWRSKKKKKKNRKKGLRSKLLRITEDDSLFDSSSDSTSDESSDSSSSSDSKSESREHKSDHGHKKIVVFNKRPKPPLPSFIFLPNMETPFFPPIGLPPPPMPMYPMVPVPPMMAPFPFPAPTPCASITTDASTTAASTSDSGITGAVTEAAPAADSTEARQDTNDQENIPEENEAEPEPNEEAQPAEGEIEAPADNPLRLRGKKNRKNRPRNKLVSQNKVQKLRDKLKRKNKLQNYFAQNYQHSEMQMIPPPNMEPQEDYQLSMQFHPRQKDMPDINVEDEFAGLQDIDFKYLSQLIHRADLNKTSPSPPTPFMVPPSTPGNDNMLSVHPPSRRNYGGYPDQMTQALSKLDKSNLANHPVNLNPENQPLFHSLKQSYIPNQPANNPMNQFGSNQPTYKPQNQLSFDTANQQTYKQPTIHNQQLNDGQNSQTYNSLNKPSFDSQYNQPSNNVPGKPFNDAPNVPYQLSLNTPYKPTHNSPVQQSFQSSNREESQFFDHQYTKRLQNVPHQQPPKEPNQASYNVPNRRYNTAPNQPEYNAVRQHGYSVNQPTYVSLNKPLPSVSLRKKIEDTNDTYYSNLGRQIASMIRNIDGDKDVDIEIKANVPGEPIINGNDGSRSYWERYVRSPYKMINSFKKEIDHLKNSNENLFSLENKVSLVALKEPAMSLNELENIISRMQQSKQKNLKIENIRHHRYKTTKPSKVNFNINLLSDEDVIYTNRLGNKVDGKTDWLPPTQNSPKKPFQPAGDLKMLLYLKSNISSPPLTPDHDLGSLLTNYMFPLQSPNKVLNETIPNTSPKIIPTRKPNNMSPQMLYKMPPQAKGYSYTVLPIPMNPALLRHNGYDPAFMQATTKRSFYQQLSPVVLNHQNLQIYDRGNINQFLFEKTSIPVQQKAYGRVEPINPYETYRSRVEPSYFHHEVHHFGYFDDLV